MPRTNFKLPQEPSNPGDVQSPSSTNDPGVVVPKSALFKTEAEKQTEASSDKVNKDNQSSKLAGEDSEAANQTIVSVEPKPIEQPASVEGLWGLGPWAIIWVPALGVVLGIMLLAGLVDFIRRMMSGHVHTPQVDHKRAVRGQFKPVKRLAAATDDQVALTDAQNTLAGEENVAIREKVIAETDEEFDFSADMNDAVYVSEEPAEARIDQELDSKISQPGLALAMAKSNFDSDSDMVRNPSELPKEAPAFDAVQSTPKTNGFKEDDFTLGGEDELYDDDDSELDMDLGADATFQSDFQLEEEIRASESSEDFSSLITEQSDEPSTESEEEAAMNFKDDDSNADLNFDLDGEVDFGDSDPDFDFDVEDTASKAKAESASSKDVNPTLSNDELITGNETASDAGDDSAEFDLLFDDASSELDEAVEISDAVEIDATVEIDAAVETEPVDLEQGVLTGQEPLAEQEALSVTPAAERPASSPKVEFYDESDDDSDDEFLDLMDDDDENFSLESDGLGVLV